MRVRTTHTHSYTHTHTHGFYGKGYNLNKTVEIDFIAQIKNLEQNVKQQNINKTMILTNSLNNALTCRHLFLHSSHSSTNQTMQTYTNSIRHINIIHLILHSKWFCEKLLLPIQTANTQTEKEHEECCTKIMWLICYKMHNINNSFQLRFIYLHSTANCQV